MTAVWELRAKADALYAAFEAAIAKNFPGKDRWDWSRAVAHMRGENVRRNNDTSLDKAMADCAEIREAHDAHIKALHAFYRARDGEHGVLGRLHGT